MNLRVSESGNSSPELKTQGFSCRFSINSFNQKLGGDISKIKNNSKEIDLFLEKTPKDEKDTESIGVYIETIKRMNQKNLAILNKGVEIDQPFLNKISRLSP